MSLSSTPAPDLSPDEARFDRLLHRLEDPGVGDLDEVRRLIEDAAALDVDPIRRELCLTTARQRLGSWMPISALREVWNAVVRARNTYTNLG